MELTKAQIIILRQQVEKQESVFKEKRYLESLSSPSLLIGREKEATKLLELFLQNDGYLVPFASIIGRSGTGKSTLVRVVCESVSDSISFSFTDLRRGSTQFNWVNLMLQELDSVQAKPHEGINKALYLLEERIIEMLQRDSKNRFVLVLDEFDIVFSRENYSDFIYKIFNAVENIRRKGYWMCVVAISNTKISEYTIDERIRSRINDCEICFSNYRSSDLFEILKARARHAFRETVSEDVLKECAKLCATETGDCRHALELLRITGEVAHGNTITINHVNEAFLRLNSDNILENFERTTTQQKILLLSIAYRELWYEKSIHTTKEIYSTYESLILDNYRKLSYRRIFELLRTLEELGLVVGSTTSKGRHGFQREYKMLIDGGIVGWKIDVDWWCKQMEQKAKSDKAREERIEKYKQYQKELKARYR